MQQKDYEGFKAEQAKRMKELEKENTRLRRLMAEFSLTKIEVAVQSKPLNRSLTSLPDRNTRLVP